jgi:hypothetical protein
LLRFGKSAVLQQIINGPIWQKLEAFPDILSKELAAGPRTESILLLALGSIKQDIINLDLSEVGK